MLGRRRPSRAEEGARGEQPYVDRYTINLINNPCRPERAAVHLSASYAFNCERGFSSGGGEHLRPKKKRAVGEGNFSGGKVGEPRHVHEVHRQSQADKIRTLPRREEEASSRMPIDTSSISVS